MSNSLLTRLQFVATLLTLSIVSAIEDKMADSDSDDAPLKPKTPTVKVERLPKKMKSEIKQEDNDDVPLIPKARAKPAPKTAVKSEDSDEEPLVKASKASPKAAAAKKPATSAKASKASASKAKDSKVKGGVKKDAGKGKGKGGKDSSKAKAKAKSKAKGSSKDKGEAKPKKVEEDHVVFKWWEEKVTLPEGHKWMHLEHNGCMFPPEYTSHGQKMLYQGQPVSLTLEQEEVATMYASMLKTDYVAKPIFIKNFWAAFTRLLGPRHVIQDLKHCDFSPIERYLDDQRAAKKLETTGDDGPAVRRKLKEEKDIIEAPYKYAVLDNHKEQTGNFRVEPPGLFRGRGEHPRMGQLKRRITSEDITMSCGKSAVPPICTIPGRAWRDLVHNVESTWLAKWEDSINGETKFIYLAASSSLKGKSDRDKFERARNLKKHISDVRTAISKGLQSKSDVEAQLFTATWIIDNLALRVGGEKDEDEADTVGCCSLRTEHVEVTTTPVHTFKLDFLGKDSIRYTNEITLEKVRKGEEQNFKRVVENIIKFKAAALLRQKEKQGQAEDIFELTPSDLNDHLRGLVAHIPGMKLSAKVFRTFNASQCLAEQLNTLTVKQQLEMKDNEKLLFFNDCNFQVAVLCNHCKTPAKNFGEKQDEKKKQLLEMEKVLKELKKDKADKKKVDSQKKKIDDFTTKMKLAEKLAGVALGTSRLNYIDPRITLAWCKEAQFDFKRLFPKTQQAKFQWAIDEIINSDSKAKFEW